MARKSKEESHADKLACGALIRCGILGCGNAYPGTGMRTYRLGDDPIPCCFECWNSMGIGLIYRDTKELK